MKMSLIFNKLPIIVEYKHHLEELQIRWDNNMEGYPGYPEYVEILDLYHAGEKITDFIAEMDLWEDIEKLVLKELHKE